jgi:hypothetical protein
MNSWKWLRRIKIISLCGLFLATPCLRAWSQGESAGSSPQLVISILDGEGALNDIRQRTAREPIVQVEDNNHKPIAGAVVLFTLPGSGPSGTFAGGAQTLSTITDSAGRAVAHGLVPNNQAGTYSIHVQVTYNGSTAETTIHQQNVSHASASEHAAHAVSVKVVMIVVATAAAAGGVAAAIVLTKNASTTIAAGSPTVGAPTVSPGFRINFGRTSH